MTQGKVITAEVIHPGFRGLVAPDDVASLKYLHTFSKSRLLEISSEI